MLIPKWDLHFALLKMNVKSFDLKQLNWEHIWSSWEHLHPCQ